MDALDGTYGSELLQLLLYHDSLSDSYLLHCVYSVSQKKSPPPRGPDIFFIFSQTVENL